MELTCFTYIIIVMVTDVMTLPCISLYNLTIGGKEKVEGDYYKNNAKPRIYITIFLFS